MALATVGALMWLIERRLLGVSGSFVRLVTAEDADSREVRRLLDDDPDALEAALLAATLEEFGEEAVQESAAPVAPAPPEERAAPRLPWTVHLVFLAAMAAGGGLATWLAGTWELRFDLGATHSSLLAGGPWTFVVLLMGGIAIGLGTRMAGGCTTGHGLIGCARLQPGSLVATPLFFGTAIAVSFALLLGGG